MAKKQALLKAAETRVREGGYNNFSFRELAKDVGIKSASVHYHFPTKADMGAELTRQYTDNFLSSLNSPESLFNEGLNPVATYINSVKQAIKKDNKMCLCALLGAESDVLPSIVKDEIKRFFELNLDWLTRGYAIQHPDDAANAHSHAVKILSTLEGAMMITVACNEWSLFEQATEHLSY